MYINCGLKKKKKIKPFPSWKQTYALKIYGKFCFTLINVHFIHTTFIILFPLKKKKIMCNAHSLINVDVHI